MIDFVRSSELLFQQSNLIYPISFIQKEGGS